MRLYIFGPGEHTCVHDHTSWGVFGPAFGTIEVVRYRREDDGTDPWQAQVRMSSCLVLRPGETESTLPFDQGIHRTGNPVSGTTLMVSIYGPPLRRPYIQCFHLDDGRVHRVYPPRVRKRMLTEQALKMMAAARTPN
jgi:predicted metal-dependent enzyme (double-stranded beta helix superfamily)